MNLELLPAPFQTLILVLADIVSIAWPVPVLIVVFALVFTAWDLYEASRLAARLGLPWDDPRVFRAGGCLPRAIVDQCTTPADLARHLKRYDALARRRREYKDYGLY